ncbi:MAG TPA: carbon-nitrogen hydrolase family protein [Ktedonobacteraceae bacterium]|jgi:predicted amidohydrolase|nr:carbon-nitrogen hydrolase family protein [Ktedonobacteraceae bacterium]
MVTIAVVQFQIAQFEVAQNLAKMERFIQEAAAAHAQIIVFPEDVVTGPVSGNQAYVDFTGTYVKHFQQLARRYGIAIVPGSIIEGTQDGWYNTAYYIDSTGEIQGRYRKNNLWHPERSYLAAGDTVPVFETAYGKVGLLICWDLIFPEVFRSMVQQAVDIVICPSYWCFEDAGVGLQHDANAEVNAVNALCTARAFENEIALVFVNAASAPHDDSAVEHLVGRSQIAVPFKATLQRLDHNNEAMFIQTLETGILKDAETAYTIRDDLARARRVAR